MLATLVIIIPPVNNRFTRYEQDRCPVHVYAPISESSVKTLNKSLLGRFAQLDRCSSMLCSMAHRSYARKVKSCLRSVSIVAVKLRNSAILFRIRVTCMREILTVEIIVRSCFVTLFTQVRHLILRGVQCVDNKIHQSDLIWSIRAQK